MQISVICIILPIDFNSDKHHDEQLFYLINNVIVFIDVLLFV